MSQDVQTPPLPAAEPIWVAPPPPLPRDEGQDAGMRLLLPVGRSWVAIAAGYLGLFAILVIPAPLALAFGIWAVRHIKADPKRHGMGRAIFGIVMGSLFTAGALLFLLLVGLGSI
ncbi:MAG: hypothetical protein BIFFINMI_03410 [Phycisphaerae bacterium]|nr:hypothetical protein [Phycisphaerae bacterium]